jgi:methane/ammonia monooxygenase subunit C
MAAVSSELGSRSVAASKKTPEQNVGSRSWSGWVKPGALGCAFLLLLYTIVLNYQRYAGWKYGLDSTLPEFDTYWLSIFRVELFARRAMDGAWWLYLLLTRDRNLSALAPTEEISRYFVLLGMLLGYVFAVYWGASYFAEQDGSWHQTVLRDTSFTPSHIFIFYLSFPVYIIYGVACYLYAMTRLPKFASGISIPFAVAVTGPFMILPNVGLNEWGHAFWMMEEWFTAPLHWGFVMFGWSALALFGLAFQIAIRLVELFRIVDPTMEAAAASKHAEA